MRISEVARALGCSVRTIRHYHQQGVVPEPERKANGYRDYSLADLAALVKVRQLVVAGIPLKSVVVDSEDELYDAALAEIDRKIVELGEQRVRLLRLRDNPPMPAPRELMAEVEKVLAAGGLSEQDIAQEIDAWNLMSYSGVATDQTWRVLQANVHSTECVSAVRQHHQLWVQLGETEPGPKCDALAEQWFAAYSDGVMNGIIETLTPGYLDLQPNDIAAHNGQVVALELIRR
ncbi:MerR family transcriptional regulator [Corynebacterium phoceense]|uniref:helix-turn-helix domain-containing protein n=1 Tax=Corynebacterium phoceense TaxID=1686286 RepID=UPI0034CEA97A